VQELTAEHHQLQRRLADELIDCRQDTMRSKDALRLAMRPS
jgi:hypothetical protein